MGEAQPFSTGDRVRVKPGQAEGWVQPYRNWIKAGRLATVVNVWRERYRNDQLGPWNIKISFDMKSRKYATTGVETVREDDIELVAEAPPQ